DLGYSRCSSREPSTPHLRDEGAQLALQAAVLRSMLRPSRETGPFQQGFFGAEMLDAGFHQLLRICDDQRPGCITINQQQEAAAILDQLPMKGVDVGTAGLERRDPFEMMLLGAIGSVLGMPTSAGCRSGGRRLHGYSPAFLKSCSKRCLDLPFCGTALASAR